MEQFKKISEAEERNQDFLKFFFEEQRKEEEKEAEKNREFFLQLAKVLKQ